MTKVENVIENLGIFRQNPFKLLNDNIADFGEILDHI